MGSKISKPSEGALRDIQSRPERLLHTQKEEHEIFSVQEFPEIAFSAGRLVFTNPTHIWERDLEYQAHVGDMRYQKEKDKGVEVGRLLKKGWKESDQKKLMRPLFKTAQADGTVELADHSQFKHGINKQRLIAINAVALLLQKNNPDLIINDQLLYQIDQGLNQLLEPPQNLLSEIEELDKKARETNDALLNLKWAERRKALRPYLAMQEMLQKTAMMSMEKFNKTHMQKMTYEEGFMGRLYLPWKRITQLFSQKSRASNLLYFLGRVSTPAETNLDVLKECMANDLYRNMGLQCQDLTMMYDTHNSGFMRYYMSSKFAVGDEHYAGLEDPAAKKFKLNESTNNFVDPTITGLQKYETFDEGHLQAGQFVETLPVEKKSIPIETSEKNLRAAHFQDQGMYGPLFYLFADRDALGSRGGNKMISTTHNQLFVIDPGKSLADPDLLTTFNMNDDFSISPPKIKWTSPQAFFKTLKIQFMYTRVTQGYKNFSMFEDAPLAEKMQGMLLIAKLKMTDEDFQRKYGEVIQTYDPAFEAQLSQVKSGSDDAVFQRYQTFLAKQIRCTEIFIEKLSNIEEFMGSQKTTDPQSYLLYKNLYEAYQKGGMKALEKNKKFHRKAIFELEETRNMYLARRNQMIDMFSEPGRDFLSLNKDELTAIDHIEKLLSRTTNVSSKKTADGHRVQLRHLRVEKRARVKFETAMEYSVNPTGAAPTATKVLQVYLTESQKNDFIAHCKRHISTNPDRYVSKLVGEHDTYVVTIPQNSPVMQLFTEPHAEQKIADYAGLKLTRDPHPIPTVPVPPQSKQDEQAALSERPSKGMMTEFKSFLQKKRKIKKEVEEKPEKIEEGKEGRKLK